MGKEALDRQNWLHANGFEKDPFEISSFHGETDLWLNSLGAYVDWENINSLIGNLDFPGYRFIFSEEGGGKTSIIKRIHSVYDDKQLLEDKPNVLVLDYSDHTYSDTQIDISHHVKRIINQAEKILGKRFANAKKLVDNSPYSALKKMIKTCQEKFGFLGVYVLVDNVNSTSFHKIKSLVSSSFMFNLKGFVIKYFLNQELLLLSRSKLPLFKFPTYFLKWNEKGLLSALKRRLTVCLHPDLKYNQKMQPILHLSNNEMSEFIVNNFVKLGEIANSPRLMWQFGHNLLEEHLAYSNNIRATDLIGYDAVARAYLKLFDDFKKNKMALFGIEEAYQDRLLSISHTNISSKNRSRLRVFICCEERHEKAVYDDLYFKLNSKNYDPWMVKFDVLPGAKKEYEIQNAIKNADVFLLCLSSKSKDEVGVFQKSIKLANTRQKEMPVSRIFIIPIRLEDCEISDEFTDDVKLGHVDWFQDDQKMRLFYALDKLQKQTKRKKE